MLGVVCVLVYLYVSAGASIVSTWRLAASNRGRVASMESQNRELRDALSRLRQPNTIIEAGRRLGLQRPGEVSFFETGLPNN